LRREKIVVCGMANALRAFAIPHTKTSEHCRRSPDLVCGVESSLRAGSTPHTKCFCAAEKSRRNSSFPSLTAELWPKDGKHDYHCCPDHSSKEHVHLYQTTVIEDYHPRRV